MNAATPPRLGLGLPLEGDLETLLALAVEAEELGYASVWTNDDRLQYDTFSVLTAIAQRTRHVQLGPGVTNPYSRHPALIASAIATVDALSGGRAALGLGAGGTNHGMLGVQRVAPATGLREAIEVIRGLLASQTVTVEGRVITAREAHLDFTPVRDRVPIHIGARGPRVLELAGELADGVIVGNVATREGWDYALGRIGAGAARAGRDLAGLQLTAWLYACIDDDGARAVDAIRPMVATSLVTSRPILADLGVEMPAAFAREMERCDWRLSPQVTRSAGALLPEDVVSRFGIAGTAEGCAQRVGELVAAVPEISEVVVVPFAPAGGMVADTVRRFAEQVAVGAAIVRPAASGCTR